MKIRRALPNDAGALTEIAVAAKSHWGYPPRWMLQWQAELTITPEYIAAHPTFVATIEDTRAGFVALQPKPGEASVDHLWVLPGFMGQGVGRALFEQAETAARASGARRLMIVGDPHAENFYTRMGAKVYGHEPANMDGQARLLPLLEKTL